MEKLYNIVEATKVLKLTRPMLYVYNKQGKIKLVDGEHGLNITESDLNKLVKEREQLSNAYKISEVAAILNVTRWTIYEHERKGDISFTKIGGQTRISKSTLNKLKRIRKK